MRRARRLSLSGVAVAEPAAAAAAAEPPPYTACWDATRSKHYYVSETGVTVWDLPDGAQIVAADVQVVARKRAAKMHRAEVEVAEKKLRVEVAVERARGDRLVEHVATLLAASRAVTLAHVAVLEASVHASHAERAVDRAALAATHAEHIVEINEKCELARQQLKYEHTAQKASLQNGHNGLQFEHKRLRRQSLTQGGAAVELMGRVRRANAVIIKSIASGVERRVVLRALLVWRRNARAAGSALWRARALRDALHRRRARTRAAGWSALVRGAARGRDARRRALALALARWTQASLARARTAWLRVGFTTLVSRATVERIAEVRMRQATNRWMHFGAEQGQRALLVSSYARWHAVLARRRVACRVVAQAVAIYTRHVVRSRFQRVLHGLQRAGRVDGGAVERGFERRRELRALHRVVSAWSRAATLQSREAEAQRAAIARAGRVVARAILRGALGALRAGSAQAQRAELRSTVAGQQHLHAVLPYCTFEPCVGRAIDERQEAHRKRTVALVAQLAHALEQHNPRHGVADPFHALLCEMVHDQHERVGAADAAAGRVARPVELELSASHAFMWALARAHGVHAPSSLEQHAARARRMQQQREHLVDAVSAERREIEEEVMRSVPRRRRGARERSGRELSAGQEGETKKKEEVPTDPRAIWKAFNTALHSEDFKKASCGAEGRQRGREGKGREHRREGVE